MGYVRLKGTDLFEIVGTDIIVKCITFQFDSDRILHKGDKIDIDSKYYKYIKDNIHHIWDVQTLTDGFHISQ